MNGATHPSKWDWSSADHAHFVRGRAKACYTVISKDLVIGRVTVSCNVPGGEISVERTWRSRRASQRLELEKIMENLMIMY